jgi:hypothetical protein
MAPYTLRRLRGLQPLCGIGVTSRINEISSPAADKERIAASLPPPGPFTNTSIDVTPISMAFLATAAAAVWAANGVPLRDPLNPSAPDEDQHTMFPPASETEIMVLLKLALIWA